MTPETLRPILERTCAQVLERYRLHRQDPAAREIALARIDGIFDGCLACARALGEDVRQGGTMDVARELTEKYQREIMREG